MKKLNILLFGTLVSILLLVLLFFINFDFSIFSDSFKIKFKNTTDSSISELKITYEMINEDIAIPTIKANSSLDIEITPTENFDENAMKLYYFDNKGSKHEEFLVGYFEKGWGGRVYVDIIEIDSNGKLTLEIVNK